MILIVGAGPVGLIAALRLQQHNVPFCIIEKRDVLNLVSKASTFLPVVLSFFADMGLLPELIKRGEKNSCLKFIDLDKARDIVLDLQQLEGECEHPYRLHVEQHHLCDLIIQKLKALAPGSYQPGLEFMDVKKVGSSFEVISKNHKDEVGRTNFEWIIGADGANSRVRDSMNLSFDGYDYPEPILRLFFKELPESLRLQLAGVTYFRNNAQTLSILRMKHEWRIIIRAKDTTDKQLLDPDWQLSYLNRFFAENIWQDPARHSDLYRVSQRLAEKNAVERSILVGDASHITNTRGGMNMNVGIIDGLKIADALAQWWYKKFNDGDVINVAARRHSFAQEKLFARTEQMANTTYIGNAGVFDLNKSKQSELNYLRKAAMLDIL